LVKVLLVRLDPYKMAIPAEKVKLQALVCH
jgi:hypothetical protein